jgi:DNA-binding MarR family transcriptional regulator
MPADIYTTARHLDSTEWQSILNDLQDRGLVDDTGHLSESGRSTKDAIEAQTDQLAASAFATLSDDELTDLVDSLQPITAAVVRAGEIPTQSPMGLNLNESSPLSR